MTKTNTIAAAILLLGVSAQVRAQDASACAALEDYTAGPADLRITEAAFHSDRRLEMPGAAQVLPPHCHVAGSFEHRTGINDVEYAIGFAVNMPENWNGRFLFQGGGGLNGSIREPVGAVAAGAVSALERGFAVVSTDSGHQGAGFDASFMADQQALLNFQFLANARTTEVVRPLVEAYYGRNAHHSYFVGCSTGGREGMIMAQRFPDLFDGIVSGAPAMRTTVSNLALRWFSNQFVGIEGTNARDPLTDAEQSFVMSELMRQCDALDGNADGLIFNRNACNFDARALSCSVRENAACLADEKADALARAMAGPVNAAGLPVYVGFPWDAGIDDAGGLPGLLVAGGSPPIGPHGADMASQNVDAELLDALSSSEALGSTGTNYVVSSFVDGGGKHIFYHGEADPWFSANDTVRYVETLGEANRNIADPQDYLRMYLVPGMAHCRGGDATLDQFDLLTSIVDWVERDVPPESVTATGASMPGQSRPLCPAPTYAHYVDGDRAEADSYECR